MLATASADDYRRALPLVLADPGVDSVLAIFIPPLVAQAEAVAAAIATAARGSSKPVLATFFGAAGVPASLAPVPCYVFPESAAAALARVVSYAHWRNRPADVVRAQALDIDGAVVRAIVDRATGTGGGWLDPVSAFALIAACGVETAPVRVALTLETALAAAAHFGYPVVVKGAGPTLLHKTEAKAVFTGVANEDALEAAFNALCSRPGVTQVLVQRQIRGGVEMFIGGLLDAQFGHLVMCGSGGTMLELLGDTACRLTPLSDNVAREMIEGIRGKALLRGFRASAPVHEEAYRTTLLRIAALLDLCPEIEELDLNPVIVTADGAFAVDVRVRVAATARGEV